MYVCIDNIISDSYIYKISYVNITVVNVLERLGLLIKLTHKYFASEYITGRAYRDPVSVWSMAVSLLK